MPVYAAATAAAAAGQAILVPGVRTREKTLVYIRHRDIGVVLYVSVSTITIAGYTQCLIDGDFLLKLDLLPM